MPLPRPSAEPARAYEFPRTELRRLANGFRAIVVPLAGSPVTTILVSVDAGAEREPWQQAGLSSLTVNALLEGTQQCDADELALRSEMLGGETVAEAAWADAECGVTVLAARTSDAIEMIRDVVVSPRLPEDGIRRLREERLAALVLEKEEPRGLADDVLLSAVFEVGSRYALPLAGDVPRVATIDAERVCAFHRGLYVPSNTTLIVVGDVSTADIFDDVQRKWRDWGSVHMAVPFPERQCGTARRRVVLVPRKGAPQSEVRLGHTSLPRGHADLHAVTVMNAILGGLFNSRINLNLREEHAYTYGAHSAFAWRRQCSMFKVTTAVSSDVTAAAVREIISEVARIQQEAVDETELSLARDYLTGVFPIRFETTAAIANAIATRESFQLPATYFEEYRQQIASVTSEDVLRVAREHLDPARASIVVVGDPEATRTGLEQFGEIEIPAAGQDHREPQT